MSIVDEMLGELDEWMALVRRNRHERHPGQLDTILADLGPRPSLQEATWRCKLSSLDAAMSASCRPPRRSDFGVFILDAMMYVAALINPLPALGVAPEVRPQVLEIPHPYMTAYVLHGALQQSLTHLRGDG